MEEKRLFENENGYITEDIENNRVKVYIYSVRNYDGIIGKSVNENWYNYESGLYQSWSAIDYYANYFDKYKNRNKAIESAKNDIKYID